MSPENKQLSPVDTAWWQMEHPTNLMMITGVLICKQPLDFVRVCDLLRERLLEFRPFRQRVVGGGLGLGRPHWEDDPYFSFDKHMHHIALPGDGARTQLTELLSDLSSTPLDYARPLWQAHIVENVMGGGALIIRVHHCIGDGSALVAVITSLLDQADGTPMVAQAARRPRKAKGIFESLVDNVSWLLNSTRSVVGSLVAGGIDGIQHPSHLLELGQQLTTQATRNAALVGRALTQPNDPLTPIKGPLGVAKQVAWSDDIDLAEVKQICAALDVKVNDLIVAAMAGALRSYLLHRAYTPTEADIHAVIPVDLRPAEQALDLGNVFGLVFLGLPVGEADPLARLRAVKKRMDSLKRSNEAVLYYSLLSIFGMTPKQVEEQVVDFFGARASMVFTNVVGPREPIYLAGSEIRNAVFWVPQSGRLGMGISIFSYSGRITIGVITDAGLTPDPERLTQGFADEMRLLGRVAAQRTAAHSAEPPGKPLCIATTRSGTDCRNAAEPGKAYCHRHRVAAPPPPATAEIAPPAQ